MSETVRHFKIVDISFDDIPEEDRFFHKGSPKTAEVTIYYDKNEPGGFEIIRGTRIARGLQAGAIVRNPGLQNVLHKQHNPHNIKRMENGDYTANYDVYLTDDKGEVLRW